MNEKYHIPVLLNQAIEGLNINPKGVYIDATFGGGGHSGEILKKLTTGKLIAFDQDQDAVENKFESKNFLLFKSNFRYIKNFIEFLEIKNVDGILADLGLSTHHIDVPERGFSFRFNSSLDMRMNINQEFDAKTLINSYDENELKRIFKEFGEIDNSYQIAKAVCENRKNKKIETTFDLINAIENFIPKKLEQKYLAKVFQAIRIEVNDEIEALKEFLSASAEILKTDGRFVVISYHSLEDKIVKNFFKTGNFEGERETDMYGNVLRLLEPLNIKVIVPEDSEIEINNRARSAKMRIAIKK